MTFVTPAFAQDAAASAPAGPDALIQFLPIILIFVVFYFLLIRPQQKKMKQHKDLLSSIRRGDRIVLGGGIIGSVTKVIDDERLQVEIAENVRVQVQRAMVASVLSKTDAVPDVKEPPKNPGSGTPANDGGSRESSSKGSRFTKILGGKSE